MPTEKALYSPESRAVKLAARDIRSTIKSFKEQGQIPFMQQKRSAATQRMYDEIKTSPLGSQLLAEGYPASMAYRVAQLEKQQLVERGAPAEAVLGASQPE